MRLLAAWLALSIAVAAATAQSATVSNIAGTGAGSLRAALLAANASAAPTFTIDVSAAATAGTIVLATVLPSLTRSNVVIQPLSGAGQLVVDARPATAVAGYGMDLSGNDIQVLVPCRFLVQQGNGVVVRGQRARFADLEVTGNLFGSGLVTVPGADDLVVGRFAAMTFQQGLFLNGCSRARIADDGVSTAVVQNHSGTAIVVTAGGNHTIGSFACATSELGVSVTNSPGLVLGRAGNPLSSVTACRQQGILLLQCAAPALAHIDLLGNGVGPAGGHGLQVIGGVGCVVLDLRCNGNVSGGVAVQGGASNVRIGPNVTTRGFGGAVDNGLAVFGASAVTIVDCTFGPDHSHGAVLAPEVGAMPRGVTFGRCVFQGNRSGGLLVLQSVDTLVCASVCTGNIGDGIEAVGPNLVTGPNGLKVVDCQLGANAGSGLLAQSVVGLQVGPGNRLDDNLYSGLRAYSSTGIVVTDALSIAQNRSSGIWLQDCNGVVIGRTALHANRGAGIYALQCAGMAIGPDVHVLDTVGSGLQWEQCNGCTMFSSVIEASTAHGVHVFYAQGVPGTSPHLLRSCLIADHPGLAVYHAGGPPVICQLCTIAGNLRGIVSGAQAMTVDSCIVRNNALEDLEQTATAMTVTNTFQLIPPPAGGSSNTAADPLFVSVAARDWRLQAGSPAIGHGNPAITIAPGEVDAFAGPRLVGSLDAGCHEVGPHVAPTDGRMVLSSATMANGGGGLAFHLQYPIPAASGTFSVVVAEFGPPSGTFSIFGGLIPLAPTPALLAVVQDPNSINTLAIVDPEGVVGGALLWAGVLSPSVQNQVVSLCGVAIDGNLAIRAVTNAASFTIL